MAKKITFVVSWTALAALIVLGIVSLLADSLSHSTPPRPALAPAASLDPYQSECAQYQKGCRRAVLDLYNTARATQHIAPLALDWTQSRGMVGCVGSAGHSAAMAASGQVWHVNASYPQASFPTDLCGAYGAGGENAGAGGGTAWQALQQTFQMMLAEGPGGGHYQNIMNPAYRRLGVGFKQAGGMWYITHDLLG